MSTHMIKSRMLAEHDSRLQKLMWLSMVMLTLGLCLLAWKRPMTEEVFAVDAAVVADAQVQEMSQLPAMMVIKVRAVEYPQPGVERAV